MYRMRRLRRTEGIRDLVRENRLSVKELVYPLFVAAGVNLKIRVPSMPGVFQYSLDRLPELLDQLLKAGVNAVLVFGVPLRKDEAGSEAYNRDGIAQRAVRKIRAYAPEMVIISDVCLCEYTSHGHCGLIRGGEILNDESLPLLARASVTLAEAGADMIAPSCMMDGDVESIRRDLDEAGYVNTAIMAYSAKMASGYYSPFRDAAHSAPSFGDRRSYQMDYANGREAVRESLIALDEGADIVMVKPALAYLDIVRETRNALRAPLATYNVSGEYSMVKAAAQAGWIDEKRIVMENLTAMKRAGADIIITYHAIDAAEWIREQG
ncbi:porphobilinogen synthase [Eubacterium pyruvativorans]|uniref:Delta-aminolevulinic acid dehydratase n=1 Tax=Eubacterium pyruvativorans TaxID=155865 RepID=A0A1I7HI85_9FIRM|nr:porphobilinogen synthase [Eubacterium pyruvativorans]SFO26478.1 porphobilinogen synthase [Eubacterium pyruvativorans]SFU60312.1 porphobilinogen synthase [Eubacterium pyruvativorans]HAT82169.1 porphobilinogen synthase [Eubacterium sp.]